MITKPIPEEKRKTVIDAVVKTSGPLPVTIHLKDSQISIDEIDIIAVMEILNQSEEKALPQMCSHSSKENTPPGLDRELNFIRTGI